MPQLDLLTYPGQLFWLGVTFTLVLLCDGASHRAKN